MVTVTIISLLLSYRRCNTRGRPARFRPGKLALPPPPGSPCFYCFLPGVSVPRCPGGLRSLSAPWPGPGQAWKEPLCLRREVASTGSRLSGKGAYQPANGRQAGAGRPGAAGGEDQLRCPRRCAGSSVCPRPWAGCPSGAEPAVAPPFLSGGTALSPHRMRTAQCPPKLCVPSRPSPCWAPCRRPVHAQVEPPISGLTFPDHPLSQDVRWRPCPLISVDALSRVPVSNANKYLPSV